MDTELVIRAQRGDQAAFAEIASATYGRLHSLAYGILRDRALAEDAVQQAMLDAWRNLPKLRDPARFEAWSYRLTVNVCYAEAKRAKRWMPNMPIDTPASPSHPTRSARSPTASCWTEGFGSCRSSSGRCWCCATWWACRSKRSLRRSTSHRAPPARGSIAPADDARLDRRR